MSNFWTVNISFNQKWSNFESKEIFFVTDENILIDNIETRLKESNYDVELAKDMLRDLGVKTEK